MTAYGESQWPGGENVAATPYALLRIFELFPDDTLGINLDPSHLVLQMIDSVRFIKEFGSRIYHMHAKDEAVDREGLYLRGAWALGRGWHMGRVPGLGDVDWPSVMDALYGVGYDGTVSVELEDLRFETDDYEQVARGILIGRDVMRTYVK
jgi:sugar phosphate isomerase/epimerase